MLPPTVIELSRGALRRNLRYLRQRLGAGVRLTSVVKANAYGHGIADFVPLAESCGVRRFAVSHADEAAAVVRARGEDSSVLVMAELPDEALAWAVEHDVEVYACSTEGLRRAAALAQRIGRPARLHLELETGLHRTGMEADALPEALTLTRAHADDLALEGLCTHLAGAESSANLLRIREQLALFEAHAGWLAERGLRPRRRHVAASAAALSLPASRYEMVRIGIAQYGYWPSPETRLRVLHEDESVGPRPDPLRRVICWKSRVATTKRVSAGAFVGYGTSFMAPRRLRLATVPVGYGHGFPRALSNVGHVLVHGRRASVVGLVNMSMIVVDVTDVPGVAPGDEVVLIGRQRNAQVSVAAFSDLSGRLDYETLVRLARDIPRVVVP